MSPWSLQPMRAWPKAAHMFGCLKMGEMSYSENQFMSSTTVGRQRTICILGFFQDLQTLLGIADAFSGVVLYLNNAHAILEPIYNEALTMGGGLIRVHCSPSHIL